MSIKQPYKDLPDSVREVRERKERKRGKKTGNQGDVKGWEEGKKAEYGRDIRQPANNTNLDEERAVPS